MARFSTKVCAQSPCRRAEVALHRIYRLTSWASEFRTFVDETESQLLALFKSIDRDNDGKLVKDELKAAFRRAGLNVPQRKLDQFFAEFDRDGSGAITFDEWR